MCLDAIVTYKLNLIYLTLTKLKVSITARSWIHIMQYRGRGSVVTKFIVPCILGLSGVPSTMCNSHSYQKTVGCYGNGKARYVKSGHAPAAQPNVQRAAIPDNFIPRYLFEVGKHCL